LESTQQVEAFMCPSYTGSDSTKGRLYNGESDAVGTYVAIPSTHYNADGTAKGTDRGAPDGSLFDSYSGNKPKTKAGNGVLIFAQARTSGSSSALDAAGNPLLSILQKPKTGSKPRGVKFAGIRDGTSNTIMFTESREESYASWMSGLSAYVVAAAPNGPGDKILKIPPGSSNQPAVLKWDDNDTDGQLALNVGSGVKLAGGSNATDPSPGKVSTPATEAYFYAWEDYAHAVDSEPRWYGPSSAHPGSVQHAFGDAHGKSINEDVDRDVYLHLVTRGGGEVVDTNF
jgi:hypothetical protein